jgi:hypothetical protein
MLYFRASLAYLLLWSVALALRGGITYTAVSLSEGNPSKKGRRDEYLDKSTAGGLNGR